MGIVSDIETYFAKTGKIRDYTDKVANNTDVISIQILVNGLQQIYLPQNSLLDSRKIRAVQVIAEDEQFYWFTATGTTIENLTVAALPEFIYQMPYYNLIRSVNGGFVILLEPKIINLTDCYVQINNVLSLADGDEAVFNFYYDVV